MPIDALTDTDLRFKTAQDLGLPPYTWIPPEKLPLRPTNNQRAAFPASPEIKRAFDAHCSNVLAAVAGGRVEREPGTEHVTGADPILKKVPHPLSDFHHGHPDELAPAAQIDFGKLRASLKDGTDPKLLRDLDNLEEMGRRSGPKSAAFQRLTLAFDWIMCRAYKLLNDINRAAEAREQGAYTDARDAYIDFVRNLDNHEPQESKDQVNPVKCLGYGKVVKWVYIDPIVQPRPVADGSTLNLIIGATIVIEWNPHSSSSGIPVQHP